VTLASLSLALALLAYGAFAIALIRGEARQPQPKGAQAAFFAAVVASAGWAFASLAALQTGQAWLAVGGGLFDLARYVAWFAFALAILRPTRLRHRTRRLVTLGILWAATVAIGILVVGKFFGAAAGHALGRYLSLASLALPTLGLLLVEQLFRSTAPDARWRTKPLCLGLAAIFLFDVYLHSHVLLFGQVDADSATIRGAAHALPVLLLYLGVKRSADWSHSFQLSRDVAFHTASLILIGGYLLALSGIGYYVRYVGGHWGGAVALALTCIGLVALVVLLFSGALRAKLRVFVGKHFFRYRYDYRTEWLRFTARLSAAGSPQEVAANVSRALAEMLSSPAASLWYRTAGGFVQSARWNGARSAETLSLDSPFTRFVGEREWVIDLDECRKQPQRHAAMEVPAWLMANPSHWVVVPLIVAGDLAGFVVIDRPHAALSIDWEVRDLLKTAGRQAASFLALMHATDALLEARKFEAFNKMSAFVVHDLKNIVAQLSLMMQNATRLRHNPEFQQDMLSTVENSLERMRRLMLQLRSGETPLQAAAGVSLPAIVERLGANARARGRSVELQIGDALVTRGHGDRVERVLGHLVDNALDATMNRGSVSVSLDRAGSQAVITVRDTGPGMTPEFMSDRLFKPFQSTKADGMGIGIYESRQYIHEIGGSLSVQSEPGQGTVFTVQLPLLDVGRRSEPELYSAK